MPSAGLTKRESRQRTRELQALMWEWDPIGVMTDENCPRDEYDCLVGPVMRMLESRAPDTAIADYLRKEIDEHFGLDPRKYDFLSVARRARTWFEQGWRDLAEPTTIFVALIDEGTDVWRPVSARQISGERYRIVGVDFDVSDETWQFPAGATVRCEPRTFAGGARALVAVELVDGAV